MMAWNPGEELRAYFSSATANVNGSRNLPGISHPAIDSLVDRALLATSREELVICCRALDRVLRSQRYWVPHWYILFTVMLTGISSINQNMRRVLILACYGHGGGMRKKLKNKF